MAEPGEELVPAAPAQRLRDEFRRVFPGAAPARVYRAPGRVNLIGEHTDYNDGFVLPMALDLACYAAVGPHEDKVIEMTALDLGERRTIPLERIGNAVRQGDWSDYVVGVARELAALEIPLRSARLAIHSTVPIGGGLASSAALEVAATLALLDGRALDRMELVRVCHRAETGFVGLPCGMMDQIVSVFGECGSALQIDCRSLSFTPLRLPEGLRFLAVNSMVKHDLGDSAYRQRVAECRAAADRLGVSTLRDASPAELAALDGVDLKRARHVASENERVLRFARAAAAGDGPAMGQAMVASHRSLQRDYEVSCEELDFLVSTALSVQGVLGARMTGGGFGGCTVNLLTPEAECLFRERISEAYQREYRKAPEFYSCSAAGGAGSA